jgi:hypothetical protein
MRVTALDNCCTPVDNACGVVVTDGFISVVLTQTVEAAQAITTKNAADRVCVYDPGCDSLLDLTAVISLCKVNPDAIALMTGQERVLDYAGVSVGTRISSTFDCDLRFALEVWTTIPGSACVGTPPAKQYGYFLVPCLRNATITGDITIDGANSITVELTAKTSVPSGWGVGPDTADEAYYVVPGDISNTPSLLLTPIGNQDHEHMQLTTIAPPAIPEDCGCTALTLVDSPPAINNIDPNIAVVAGGGAFQLFGSGLTGTTAVTIGVAAATSVVVVDDYQVTGVFPANLAGSYNVTATNPNGVSNALVNAVTYA